MVACQLFPHAEQNNYGDAITCDDGIRKKVVLVN
jgi:hypothetical protein